MPTPLPLRAQNKMSGLTAYTKFSIFATYCLLGIMFTLTFVHVSDMKNDCNATLNDLEWATRLTWSNMRLLFSVFLFAVSVIVTFFFVFFCTVPCCTLSHDSVSVYNGLAKSLFGAMIIMSIISTLWFPHEARESICELCPDCDGLFTSEYIGTCVLASILAITSILTLALQ